MSLLSSMHPSLPVICQVKTCLNRIHVNITCPSDAQSFNPRVQNAASLVRIWTKNLFSKIEFSTVYFSPMYVLVKNPKYMLENRITDLKDRLDRPIKTDLKRSAR